MRTYRRACGRLLPLSFEHSTIRSSKAGYVRYHHSTEFFTVAKWLTTMHPWHSKLYATFARVQQKTGRCNAHAADAQLDNPVVRW
jgi:hypothetical protein